MKRKRQGAKGWKRCTVADVQRALKVRREDPARFKRWIIATCQKLVGAAAKRQVFPMNG